MHDAMSLHETIPIFYTACVWIKEDDVDSHQNWLLNEGWWNLHEIFVFFSGTFHFASPFFFLFKYTSK